MNKHNIEKPNISLAYPYNPALSLVKAITVESEISEAKPNMIVCGYYCIDEDVHFIETVHEEIIKSPLLTAVVNPYTICRNSGIKDRKGKYIYEYDLLKLKHGLMPDSYGYLVWEESYKAWKIRQFISYGGHIDVNKYTVEVVGNIILNDDDAQIIFKQDEQEQQREICIDKSYCPSCFKK